MRKVGTALGGVVFVAVMAFAFSGTVKGFVFGLLWDEQSTLTCGGSQSMRFTGKKLRLAQGPVFSVGGDCELTLVDCDVKAPVVVSGGGNARVILRGGRLEGTQRVLDLGGNAVVTVEGTKLVGEIGRGGSARVEGLARSDPRTAAPAARKEPPPGTRYAGVICANLVKCYDQAGEYGNVSGRVIARVAADGTVARARYEGGQASAKVQACLVETAKQRRLPADYRLGAADVTCEYAGTYIRGTQMLSHNHSLVPVK